MNVADTDICGINAGDTITVEWHESDEQDRAISDSHLGPCLVYLSPLEANGAGKVWTKIYENGYDSSTKKWCVDIIIASGGKLDITIPADIEHGYYLMRTEVIALHEADRPFGADENAGAEYFPNCAQVYIIGSGTAQLPGDSAIPGVYTKDEDGIVFNLYDDYDSYPIPGGKLYEAGSAPVVEKNIDAQSPIDENDKTSSKEDEDKKSSSSSDEKSSSSSDEKASSSSDEKASSSEDEKASSGSDEKASSSEDEKASSTTDEEANSPSPSSSDKPCVKIKRRRRR
ncbi:hypothetical protein FB645_002894 [Coemansia sp. IMI 203386]|nr:hypothetical protein FB645_002894 [Coemansia sp. IMI 203386]